MADESSLMSLAPETEQPSGGSMSPGPGMPTPGGNLVGRVGGVLANSLQNAVGYATQNPQLQAQAIDQQKVQREMEIKAAANAALMQGLDKVSSGDTAGARAVLKSNPAVLFSPEGMALYGKTAEMDRAISLHKSSVDVLSSRPDLASQLAAGYLSADPSMTTEKAIGLSLTTLQGRKVEKGDDGFHIIDPNAPPGQQQIGFVPFAKIMTKKRDESIVSVGGAGAAGDVKTLAPELAPVGYFDHLNPDIKQSLLGTKGFDRTRYDMLAKAAADSPDADNRELNTWNRIGAIQADIKKNPIEWQVAAARIGVTPEEATNPTIMPPAKAAAWQNAVQTAKTEQEVKSAQGVHAFKVADMFAPDAFTSARGQEMVNKTTFESEPTAGVRGDVFQKRMDSGQWALANPIDARAAKFANAAISGVDAAQKLTQRMYHDLGPGSKDMRIEDAFKQWTAKYTASSEDTAAYRAIKVSLATEIAKALNPQGRGSDAARKEIETILPGGMRLETIGSARATLDVIRGELNNRRLTAIGQAPMAVPLPPQIESKRGPDGKVYFRADGGQWALREGQ